MNIIYFLAYLVLWPVFRIFKPTKCINKQNFPQGGALLCANHTRMSDPLFVAYALGLKHQIHVMAKEEVMHVNPFFTWFFRQVGVFGVTRGRGDTTAVEDAIEKVRAGQGLLIFPEGTRSKTGEPIPAETLYLGEHKSAAKLRENKQLLLDAWQKLYDENRFE